MMTNIYHWDEVNHEIYFKATKEDSQRETSVQSDGLPVWAARPGHPASAVIIYMNIIYEYYI